MAALALTWSSTPTAAPPTPSTPTTKATPTFTVAATIRRPVPPRGEGPRSTPHSTPTTSPSPSPSPTPAPKTLRLERDGDPLMVVGLTPAAVTFHRDDGGVRSGVTIPEHGGAVLPGSAPFGSGRWTGVAGHSSRPDGPGDFAPLLMAEAGDVLVGCNTDGQCWRYRVTRVERLDETALNRLLEERSGDLLVHTCDTNLTHYIVLTGETYD